MTHHPLNAGHLGAHHLAHNLNGGSLRLQHLRGRRLGELEPIGIEGPVAGLLLLRRLRFRLNGVVHVVAIVYDVHGPAADTSDAAEQQQR